MHWVENTVIRPQLWFAPLLNPFSAVYRYPLDTKPVPTVDHTGRQGEPHDVGNARVV